MENIKMTYDHNIEGDNYGLSHMPGTMCNLDTMNRFVWLDFNDGDKGMKSGLK